MDPPLCLLVIRLALLGSIDWSARSGIDYGCPAPQSSTARAYVVNSVAGVAAVSVVAVAVVVTVLFDGVVVHVAAIVIVLVIVAIPFL